MAINEENVCKEPSGLSKDCEQKNGGKRPSSKKEEKEIIAIEEVGKVALDTSQLKKDYDELQPVLKEGVKQLKRGMEDFVDAHPELAIFSWKACTKEWTSFLNKALRKEGVTNENAFTMITDVLRGRFVTWFVDQIKPIVDLIEKVFPNFLIREHVDYLSTPKEETGYYGYHLVGEYIINGKASVMCEIQIRSFLGHGYSEVEHVVRYKPIFGEIDGEVKKLMDEQFKIASEGIRAAELAFVKIYHAVQLGSAPTKIFPPREEREE